LLTTYPSDLQPVKAVSEPVHGDVIEWGEPIPK